MPRALPRVDFIDRGGGWSARLFSVDNSPIAEFFHVSRQTAGQLAANYSRNNFGIAPDLPQGPYEVRFRQAQQLEARIADYLYYREQISQMQTLIDTEGIGQYDREYYQRTRNEYLSIRDTHRATLIQMGITFDENDDIVCTPEQQALRLEYTSGSLSQGYQWERTGRGTPPGTPVDVAPIPDSDRWFFGDD